MIERFNGTLKRQGLARVVVPYRLDAMREEVRAFASWYNTLRPHQSLKKATPAEAFGSLDRAAPKVARIEPRARYPAGDARRVPAAAVRLRASCFEGRAHLPVVELDIAA